MPNGSTVANYKYGDITIVTFSDGSTTGNRVSSDANSVWFDLPDELSKYTGSPLSFDGRQAEVQKIIKEFQVKNLPAVVFLEKKDGTQWEVKNTLTGNVPKEAIEATYWRIINKLYGRGDNALSRAAEEQISLLPVFEGDNPLFGLPPELMKAGIGLLGLLAGYKAVTSENHAGRIAFGGVAAYTAYKLFYPGKSTIHFE